MGDIKGSTADWLVKNEETWRREWFEFLTFPSVGTDPAMLGACEDCAQWLSEWLVERGFSVQMLGESGVPANIYATRRGEQPGTVMFYGHYDVQPADFAEGWQSGPWDPTVRAGRVYARGAQDNKGQVWAALQAIRACIDTGVPLPSITVVLDGQEESGSASLMRLVAQRPELFKADLLMVSDTAMMDDGRPAIEAGLRGVSSIELKLEGASHDLHSGAHGGLAPNPAIELARMVAEMFNGDGSIAVEGFLDDAVPPGEKELALALAEPFDEIEYAKRTGVPPIGGQRGVPPRIRGSLAPTIEVNGFHSGYGGPGGKTIIPASAEVKLSMRIVMGQIPAKCLEAVRRHFASRVREGMKLTVVASEEGAPAFRVAIDSPLVMKAREILSAMHPRGCAVVYEGASIHAIGMLSEVCGGDTILAGFGTDEDRIHSPNESFSFRQFGLCFEYTSRLLTELGKGGS